MGAGGSGAGIFHRDAASRLEAKSGAGREIDIWKRFVFAVIVAGELTILDGHVDFQAPYTRRERPAKATARDRHGKRPHPRRIEPL